GSIIIDLKGDYIYPSFIDLYSNYGLATPKKGEYSYRPQYESNKEGAYHWNEAIHPEIDAADRFQYNNKEATNYINSGFGVVLTHQQNGIARGTACLVSLSNEMEQKSILSAEIASCFSFRKGVSRQKYPTSLMGSIALLKQLFLDSYWHQNSGKTTNLSFNAFNNQLELPHIFQTNLLTDYNRIYKISDEFEIDFIVKGNGMEYQRIEEIKSYEFPIILPLNFPVKYEINNPEESDILTLSKLKHWETAPFNARILSENNIDFCFTMSELKKPKDFIKNLRITIEKGLSKYDALDALTIVPSTLIGEEERLGSLEKGKKANFIICSSDIFEDGEIYENWTNGIQNIVKQKLEIDIRGNYTFNSETEEKNISITGKLTKLKMEEITSDTTSVTYEIEQNGRNIIFHTKDISVRGISDFVDGIFKGRYQNLEGENIDFTMERDSLFLKNRKDFTLKYDTIIPPIWTPNKAYGNSYNMISIPTIFTNATVWTNEEEGILLNTDVAIQDGKIIAIGTNLKKEELWPKTKIKVQFIDATDKHITCGIIDEHSHIAISHGVNEGSQAVTAEVKIGDVINPNDHNIYRQLSGGVTASQLLHGSANPIGGQSALIKLRWGSSAEQMKIEGADGFIKFALGENVKQSNWGNFNTIRFPQTRMGVEQVFYDAFYGAKEYQESWNKYNELPLSKKRKTTPPREDLELNALVEILNSERFITCHSYIQSEINMLMHVADSMGFTINTFTHILEGYKVANKLKKHGAGASTFSDWWAYKFEVNDAIPYNATILNNKGVVTAINSDDAEMGRRLNQEAAKAVKYGGTSEEDAWKMVTLNPAILLHLDNRMGSIKIGKDADIVIWTGNPLSVYSKVEQTYIDGQLLFDITKNRELMKRDLKEKMRIITKMVNGDSEEETQKVEQTEEPHYHCDTIEDYE
ncbi:MAG: amidohydrolase family protein, partial [Flavobacteriales bacterium]|nr:amidohydrolase family protein [Flavobacteriales bacterium]